MKNTINNKFIALRAHNTVKDQIEHYPEQDWAFTRDICRKGIKRELQKLSNK